MAADAGFGAAHRRADVARHAHARTRPIPVRLDAVTGAVDLQQRALPLPEHRRRRGAARRRSARRSRARPSLSSARPAPASRPCSSCSHASTTRPAAASRSTGNDLRSLDLGTFRSHLGYVPQEGFLFTRHGARQHRLRPSPALGRRGRSRRPAPSAPTTRSRRSRTGTSPRSASAAARCRPGSASSSRWPAPSWPTRRCCCSTRRPRTSIWPPRRGSPRRCSASRASAPRSSSPTGCRPREWPTGSPCSNTDGCARSARTTSCSRNEGGYARMWRAFETVGAGLSQPSSQRSIR